jgi:hypothetical protein
VLLYRQEKFWPIKVGGIKLEILRIKANGTPLPETPPKYHVTGSLPI